MIVQLNCLLIERFPYSMLFFILFKSGCRVFCFFNVNWFFFVIIMFRKLQSGWKTFDCPIAPAVLFISLSVAHFQIVPPSKQKSFIWWSNCKGLCISRRLSILGKSYPYPFVFVSLSINWLFIIFYKVVVYNLLPQNDFYQPFALTYLTIINIYFGLLSKR